MTIQSWNEPADGKDEGDDWDPAPADRVWYENRQTGDRGWLVKREGKDAIRLDRVGVDEIRTFRKDEWRPIATHRPLNKHAITLVAFEADKALNRSLGEHQKANTLWHSLTPEKRRAWMLRGPDPEQHPLRAGLYKVIMEYLGPLAE